MIWEKREAGGSQIPAESCMSRGKWWTRKKRHIQCPSFSTFRSYMGCMPSLWSLTDLCARRYCFLNELPLFYMTDRVIEWNTLNTLFHGILWLIALLTFAISPLWLSNFWSFSLVLLSNRSKKSTYFLILN